MSHVKGSVTDSGERYRYVDIFEPNRKPNTRSRSALRPTSSPTYIAMATRRPLLLLPVLCRRENDPFRWLAGKVSRGFFPIYRVWDQINLFIYFYWTGPKSVLEARCVRIADCTFTLFRSVAWSFLLTVSTGGVSLEKKQTQLTGDWRKHGQALRPEPQFSTRPCCGLLLTPSRFLIMVYIIPRIFCTSALFFIVIIFFFSNLIIAPLSRRFGPQTKDDGENKYRSVRLQRLSIYRFCLFIDLLRRNHYSVFYCQNVKSDKMMRICFGFFLDKLFKTDITEGICQPREVDWETYRETGHESRVGKTTWTRKTFCNSMHTNLWRVYKVCGERRRGLWGL